MNDYELGWLAGIIDGEGYLGLVKSRSHANRGFTWRPQFQIRMSDRNSIVRIQRLIGEGTIVQQDPRNPRWKPTWDFRMDSSGMRRLLPKLQLVTKEQHRILLLRALQLLDAAKKGNQSPKFYDRYLEKIFQELRARNTKGRK